MDNVILPLAFLKGPGWIFWPAQFIYFYFLASLIVFLFNKILKKNNERDFQTNFQRNISQNV